MTSNTASNGKMDKKSFWAKVFFALHIINSTVHIVLTNVSDSLYNVTKVLLMPLLCVFFLLSVKNLQKGYAIAWYLCGLWLGNICLIWGGDSKVAFFFGSAFTVIGIFGYVWALLREQKTMSPMVLFLQLPIIWLCAFSVGFMQEDLGAMLVPISAYMTLIAVLSMLALSQLVQSVRSGSQAKGAWLMFIASLFYIGENFFYTADHYMPDSNFGIPLIHFCFIMAQTLVVCGYLLREREGIN